jgi:hypothetical protein
MKPKHILISFSQAGWHVRLPGQESYYVLGRTIPERCAELSRFDSSTGKWMYRWITGITDDAIEEYKRIITG